MPNFALNMLRSESATIAAGTSLSAAVNLGGLRLFGLSMPSAWTTAAITFQSSYDNGVTWQNMYDASGNEVMITAAASRNIALDPVLFSAIPMIKVRSGTAGSAVNQAQDSVVTLVLRSV